MELLSGGYINQVFRNGGVVEKHYREVPTVFVPLETRYKNERDALVRNNGEHAPLLYDFDDTLQVLHMEFVRGDSMKKSIENGICAPEKAELFTYFGTILKKIHTQKAPGNTSDYIEAMRKKAWRDLELFRNSGVPKMFGIDEDKIAKLLVRYAIPELTKRAHTHPQLTYTHGDMWSNNLIEDKAIDWEFSIPGLPEEDLVQVYMWDIAKFPQHEKDFLQGYGFVPDLRPFQILKLLDYMEGASIKQVESEQEDGFVTMHARILKSIT